MIERFLLPEVSSDTRNAINLCRREMKPGIDLCSHRFWGLEGDEQMEMIGHDHEIAHVVSIAIKVHQALGDNLRKPTVSKHACSVTFIQGTFSLAIEVLLEIDAISFLQFMDGFGPFTTSANGGALTFLVLI
jgi:hypothetical protein